MNGFPGSDLIVDSVFGLVVAAAAEPDKWEFPASDLVLGGIFGSFVAVTIAGGLIAVRSLRIIRSVCGLAMASVGLAGLFYFLNSPFLALMEILIYVGAVCVTIVFAIMLAEPEEARREEEADGGRSTALWDGGALLVGALAFFGLSTLGLQGGLPAAAGRAAAGPAESDFGPVGDIGISLLTTYSMAFELISLVLLVAIVGALAVARTGRKIT